MSNIRDTDLVLVSRGGTPYDCPASDLSSRLQDNDYLLVSRGGTPYKVSGSNINNISDNDTLLISRGSTPYKVTGADFKSLLGSTYSIDWDADSFAASGVTYASGVEVAIVINDIVENSFGESYALGFLDWATNSANRDLFVFKINSNGTVAWQRSIRTVKTEFGLQGCADSNGDLVLIAYQATSSNLVGSMVAKVDRNGNVSNQSLYERPSSNQHVYPKGIVPAGNGKFLVCAYVYNSSMAFWRLNSDLSYDSSFSPFQFTSSTNVGEKIHGDGSNIYAMSPSHGGIVRPLYFVKSDLNGNVVWSKTYTSSKTLAARSVYGIDGTSVFMWNETRGSSGGNFSTNAVAKFDTSGNLLFYRSFAQNASDSTNITQDSEGNTYILMTAGSVSHVAKLDNSGNTVWMKRCQVSYPYFGVQLPSAIQINAQGMLAISFNMIMIVVNPDGNFNGTYGSHVTLTVMDDPLTTYTSSWGTFSAGGVGKESFYFDSSSLGPNSVSQTVNTHSFNHASNSI